MTDPEGIGWMDPNGFEVADKCEFGPQRGNPLGFAPDGSPFNQVVNGHEYLFQQMWSNDDDSCVQRTSLTSNPLPLPQVNFTQFSPMVSGNIESQTAGVGVKVTLVRADADGNRCPSPRRRRPPQPTAAGRSRWPRTPSVTIAMRSTSTTRTTARRPLATR